MKPSERIIQLMTKIRKKHYPKKMFPDFEKDNKMMTHLRWMAVLAYLDEQSVTKNQK